MIVRLGREVTHESLTLAVLLAEIDALPRPADRRWMREGVADTFGAAVRSRRAQVLRVLL